jgi:hypothetical protein
MPLPPTDPHETEPEDGAWLWALLAGTALLSMIGIYSGVPH